MLQENNHVCTREDDVCPCKQVVLFLCLREAMCRCRCTTGSQGTQCSGVLLSSFDIWATFAVVQVGDSRLTSRPQEARGATSFPEVTHIRILHGYKPDDTGWPQLAQSVYCVFSKYELIRALLQLTRGRRIKQDDGSKDEAEFSVRSWILESRSCSGAFDHITQFPSVHNRLLLVIELQRRILSIDFNITVFLEL